MLRESLRSEHVKPRLLGTGQLPLLAVADHMLRSRDYANAIAAGDQPCRG